MYLHIRILDARPFPTSHTSGYRILISDKSSICCLITSLGERCEMHIASSSGLGNH